MNLRGLKAWSLVLASIGALGACSSQQNDQATDAGGGEPLGTGLRIKQVMDPTSKAHPLTTTATVNISGASFVWLDTYDETHDGKSIGTVYLQDVGSNAAYSGASLYEPTYIPSNLKPAPGDVLDPSGEYDAQANIGTATFPPGELLIQILEAGRHVPVRIPGPPAGPDQHPGSQQLHDGPAVVVDARDGHERDVGQRAAERWRARHGVPHLDNQRLGRRDLEPSSSISRPGTRSSRRRANSPRAKRSRRSPGS